MTTKPEVEEPKRIIVGPEDLSALTGKSIKTSRNTLSRIRKDLDKKPGSWLTYRDIAKYFNWDEVWVKNVLYVSYGTILFWGFYLWIFRDDMDLGLTWILVYFTIRYGGWVWSQFFEGLRLMFRRK